MAFEDYLMQYGQGSISELAESLVHMLTAVMAGDEDGAMHSSNGNPYVSIEG